MKFKNVEELDFNLAKNKESIDKAFKKIDSEKGINIPLVIKGEKIYTNDKIVSINPANKDTVVGYLSMASQVQIDEAISSSNIAFEKGKKISRENRIIWAQRFISLVEENRFELIAWMVEESGKNISEADGEICELIDFTKAYMVGEDTLSKGLPDLVPSDHEKRECRYIPIGVGVAISPWNFPVSILGGMTMAALITGNSIIMKPSSDTGVVAYKLYELFVKSGFPKKLISFITGDDQVIGDFIVQHPKVRFINFTGSKKIGVRINHLASEVTKEQIWIKRIVTEMGGKNAIIVDETADLESAALGIVQSAFLMQGQKCSAASRLIVHKDIYDELLEKVFNRTKLLSIGSARENADLGPVIAPRAFNKIKEYIDYGNKHDEVIIGGEYDDSIGYFINPTIFSVTPESKIFKEEIFGPVLGVVKFDSFDTAIQLANNTEYGLTGSLYSKKEENIQKAIDTFYVGNLYINHKSTGAVVYQHPFGGFNLSGTDAKTGTTNYLLNFVELQSITRKYI